MNRRGRKPYPEAKKQQLKADRICSHIEELVDKKSFKCALNSLDKHIADITAYYGAGFIADFRDQIIAARDGIITKFNNNKIEEKEDIPF